MASLKTWTEFKAQESNARKRAVRAALNGTGPSLPGSYAACPSTNPRAMKTAAKTGVVGKDVDLDEEDRSPDYSFDAWIKKAEKLGDDVKKDVEDGSKEEEKAKKSKTDKKPEPKSDKKPSDKPNPFSPGNGKKTDDAEKDSADEPLKKPWERKPEDGKDAAPKDPQPKTDWERKEAERKAPAVKPSQGEKPWEKKPAPASATKPESKPNVKSPFVAKSPVGQRRPSTEESDS